jgi:hypothetical protein
MLSLVKNTSFYSFYQNWGFIFLTLLKDNIENFSDFFHLPPPHRCTIELRREFLVKILSGPNEARGKLIPEKT